jgi:hypothetical protein
MSGFSAGGLVGNPKRVSIGGGAAGGDGGAGGRGVAARPRGNHPFAF